MRCERCLTEIVDAHVHGLGLCPLEARPSLHSVIGDEIPGGMVIENMGPRPMTFYSRSAHRAAMQRLGLRPHVQHVGVPGTDKSPHTSRWV